MLNDAQITLLVAIATSSTLLIRLRELNPTSDDLKRFLEHLADLLENAQADIAQQREKLENKEGQILLYLQALPADALCCRQCHREKTTQEQRDQHKAGNHNKWCPLVCTGGEGCLKPSG
jgi:hypothetical protein